MAAPLHSVWIIVYHPTRNTLQVETLPSILASFIIFREVACVATYFFSTV